MSDQKESSLFAWFTRFRRRKHEQTLLETLAEAKHFKDLIAKQYCTACGQNGLILDKFGQNLKNPKKGWEAEVSCGNCNFHGIVNSQGFDFQKIGSKGKAVDK